MKNHVLSRYILWISVLGLNGCGLADICDLDNDEDGINNCEDVCPFHADPKFVDRNEFNTLNCTCEDSDEDGVIDCLDRCPEHPNLEPTICGCDIEPVGEGVYLTCPEVEGLADRCPNDPNKDAPGVCGCGISDRMIVWDDDALTMGNPISECPASDNIDLCPFDSDKYQPGICGCGIADIDTDGDDVPDCKDRCPDDSGKTEPGACGCGVEDSAVNLMDSDKDGTIDCLDECPNNPYKIVPGQTGCDHQDTDGDGIEDQDDICPYNPDIYELNADGEKPDCNYVINSEDQSVFRVWDAHDLIRLRNEIKTEININRGMDLLCAENSEACYGNAEFQVETMEGDMWLDEPTITTPGVYIASCRIDEKTGLSISSSKKCQMGCYNEFVINHSGGYTYSACYSGSQTTLVCGGKTTICLDENTQYRCDDKQFDNCLCQNDQCVICESGIVSSGGKSGDCCEPSEYKQSCSPEGHLLQCNEVGRVVAKKCINACTVKDDSASCIIDRASETPYLIEIMKDLDLSSVIKCDRKFGNVGAYQSIDLYNVVLKGNNHRIHFGDSETKCAISRSVFNNIVQSKIYDLTVDVNVRGNVNSAVATYIDDSLIDNLVYKGDVIVDQPINGEEIVQSKRCRLDLDVTIGGAWNYYQFEQNCDERVFGAIAGYVNNSVLNHIKVLDTIATRREDLDISGFIGISNNVFVDDLNINTEFIAAPTTKVSTLVMRSFDKLLFDNARINIDEVEAYMFYGLEAYGEEINIKNSDIYFGMVDTNAYYPFVGSRIYYVDDLTQEPAKSEIARLEMPYDIYNVDDYDNPIPSFCYFQIDCMAGICCNYPRLCESTDYCHTVTRKVELDNFRYYQNYVKSAYMSTGDYSAILKNVSFYGRFDPMGEYGYGYYGFLPAEPGWLGLFNMIESIDSSVISIDMQNSELPMLGTHYSTENANKIYWLKRHENNYAFASYDYGFSADSNDDGTVFKPFTISQTDDVVSALGTNWTKKLVHWTNPETDADEDFYIPWLKFSSDE